MARSRSVTVPTTRRLDLSCTTGIEPQSLSRIRIAASAAVDSGVQQAGSGVITSRTRIRCSWLKAAGRSMALARLAVTCVTLTSMLPRASDPLPPKGRTSSLRLPGAVLQGILARAALAFLRVYLGLLFLYASIPQLRGGFAVELSGFLNDVALIKSAEFYREFLHAVVLPNAPLFARLISWGELLVGISLLLGLATRLSAAGALLLLVHCLLAQGGRVWYPSRNHGALAAITVAINVGGPRRNFGVYALLGA